MHSSDTTRLSGGIDLDRQAPTVHGDPLTVIERALVKLHTCYLRASYPFSAIGSGVSIHYSSEIPRQMAPRISLGAGVFLGKAVWLNVVGNRDNSTPAILLGDHCAIGRNSVISAKNRIVVESGVLLAPGVLIMDHNHEFSDIDRPIRDQGTTAGGTITIEANSWLGYHAAIVCSRGDLTIGRHSVVAANAVVTKSIPPCSIVAGNPAKVIRRFDHETDSWVRVVEQASSDRS